MSSRQSQVGILECMGTHWCEVIIDAVRYVNQDGACPEIQTVTARHCHLALIFVPPRFSLEFLPRGNLPLFILLLRDPLFSGTASLLPFFFTSVTFPSPLFPCRASLNHVQPQRSSWPPVLPAAAAVSVVALADPSAAAGTGRATWSTRCSTCCYRTDTCPPGDWPPSRASAGRSDWYVYCRIRLLASNA